MKDLNRLKQGTERYKKEAKRIRDEGVEVNDILRRAKEQSDNTRSQGHYIESERRLMLSSEISEIMGYLDLDASKLPSNNRYNSVAITIFASYGLTIFGTILLGLSFGTKAVVDSLWLIVAVASALAILWVLPSENDKASDQIVGAFYTGMYLEYKTELFKNYEIALKKVDPDYKTKASYFSSLWNYKL